MVPLSTSTVTSSSLLALSTAVRFDFAVALAGVAVCPTTAARLSRRPGRSSSFRPPTHECRDCRHSGRAGRTRLPRLGARDPKRAGRTCSRSRSTRSCRAPMPTNFNVPGMFGEFPKRLPGRPSEISLSRPGQDAHGVFARRRSLPLQAFPGTLGVARKEPGRYSSVPPGDYRRQHGYPRFHRGTSLYVPVLVPGALLWSGDSHAAQGNGEVNLTALETAYKELNITVEVIKGKPLDFPRIETPTSLDHDGLRPGPQQGMGQAKAQTVKFLSEQRKRRAGRRPRRLMADGVGLPRLASGQRQEGHSLPQPEERARRGHGAPDQGDAEILRHRMPRMPT